jgi:hypothetical protein
MALTDEQKRRVRLHLRVAQVMQTGTIAGGVPVLTQYTHSVETALNELTADGETTVIALLTELDAARSAASTHYARAGVIKVEDVELSDSSRGLREKRDVYASLVADLASCLGVDPPTRSGSVWAEP